jgi:WD40 repeat protein/DNA-binding SARP family transcriptional activator
MPIGVLTINLLGAARVSLAGRPLDLRVRKELALLAYLAVQPGQPHRRDQLLGLLWPEVPEEAARNNLRVVLAGLRRTLGDAADAVLQVDRQQVRFLAEAGHGVDVLLFRRLLQAVRTHPHTAPERCDACVARLAEATEFYSGDLLHGFSLPDSAPFEEWAAVQREQLHHQQLGALDTLTRAAELRGDHASQCDYARRQLALEPWREQAHAQLMRGLHASGQRGAALEQYEICRRILNHELGLEPSPELIALAEQLRATPASSVAKSAGPLSPAAAEHWNDAPTVGRLYGRADPAAMLDGWLAAGVRVVVVLGIGGVGKTALAASVVRAASERFEAVVWRSLINAPPLDETLRAVLDALGRHSMLPQAGLDQQLDLLLRALRERRCLLVLDNLESILEDGRPGVYRAGYAPYGQLMRRLGEHEHRSSLLVTSRELPSDLSRLDAATPALRVVRLAGLDATAGGEMLAAQGLTATSDKRALLVARYSGNPLALKLVAQTIEELFLGDVDAFLAGETLFPDDIAAVLDQQRTRLSALEWELLLWLAIEREPVTAAELRTNLVPTPTPQVVLQALQALRRRSLVEQSAVPGGQAGAAFSLQNVILEYATAYLVDEMCQEIAEGPVQRLQSHALLKAQAKEYVRQSQERLLLRPVAERLWTRLGAERLANRIRALLDGLREAQPRAPGYAGGNLLNLLIQLNINPSRYDFSRLSVWQADLRGVPEAALNLAASDLSGCAFTLDVSVYALGFDPSGQLLTAASWTDALAVWRIAGGQVADVLIIPEAHVVPLTLSRDGRLLAGCCQDHAIRVWSTETGAGIQVLHGHSTPSVGLAFSDDARLLASVARDGAIRMWDVASGVCRQVFQQSGAFSTGLAFQGSHRLFTGGGGDGTAISVWDIGSGRLAAILHGHTREVECLAVSPDGALLASGAHDGTILLWALRDAERVELRTTLRGHARLLRALAFRADGRLLASSSADGAVRLWDAHSAQPRQFLSGHTTEATHLCFHPNGQTLASASADRVMKLWDVASGRALASLNGFIWAVRTVCFHPDGRRLASVGADSIIRLWEVERQQLLRSFHSHGGAAVALAFSPDGRVLASAGTDAAIRIWEVATSSELQVVRGHAGAVLALSWSPDGRVLASSSADHTIRLWPWQGAASRLLEERVLLLHGHTDAIPSVAFDRSVNRLVSSGHDHTVRVWDVVQGKEISIFRGHTRALCAAAFSPDGSQIGSIGWDNQLLLWDATSGEQSAGWGGAEAVGRVVGFVALGDLVVHGSEEMALVVRERATGRVVHTLRGHTSTIASLDLSPVAPLVATSSWDGTVRLWDVVRGTCEATLRAPAPYAGMDITGASGVTAAQRASLVALGATNGSGVLEP